MATTTSTSEPWEGQKTYLKGGYDKARRLLEQGPADYYPDRTLAGFDPLQLQAQRGIANYVRGPRATAMQKGSEGQLLGTYGQARNLANYGNLASQYGLTQGQYGAMTPFSGGQMAGLLAGEVDLGPRSPFAAVAQGMGQQAAKQLGGTVLPGIRTGITQYHPGGSTRGDMIQKGAVGAAAEQLQRDISGMYADAYGQAQGRRLPAAQMGLGAQESAQPLGLAGGQLGLSGMSQYPTIMSAPINMMGALGEVGGARRAMDQESINRDIQRYMYDANKTQSGLNQYMANLSGNFGGKTTSSGGGTNWLGTALGLMIPKIIGM